MSIATNDNRLAVAELANTIGSRIVVEIGVRRGRGAIVLLEHIPTLERLYLVDPWIQDHKAQQEEMSKHARSVKRWAKRSDKVEVLHMRSDEAAARFGDGSLDFVYIDGDHSEKGVTADIKNYRPKIRAGGILAGDDYDLPEVAAAVDRLLPGRQLVPGSRIWLLTC